MAAICVFCASSTSIDRRWLDLAREVGAELAKRGHQVVSGGGCVGMMGTLATGARAAGGHTFGVIPQSLVDLEVADHDADELVITDGMAARKTILIDRADAFLVLPGGLGTLDELFEVWTTATLGLHNKRIVLLNQDDFFTGLLEWLNGLVEAGFVRPTGRSAIRVVSSVDDALDALEDFG
ncbi:MAG: TIGR00730 family Rossman fold protein [Micromonosporaceae bacterium]|nr:TIGR00730 family Rossman fold protein [Micromonosporaceae bacterium]